MKNHKKETWKNKNKNTKTDTKPDDTDGKTVVVSDCLNIEQGVNAYRRQWKHSVISKWLAIKEDRYFPPSLFYSGIGEGGGKWDVERGTWQVRPGKVGLLWREMAIYVAENGVGLSDIFIALQAWVTFSAKQND